MYRYAFYFSGTVGPSLNGICLGPFNGGDGFDIRGADGSYSTGDYGDFGGGSGEVSESYSTKDLYDLSVLDDSTRFKELSRGIASFSGRAGGTSSTNCGFY